MQIFASTSSRCALTQRCRWSEARPPAPSALSARLREEHRADEKEEREYSLPRIDPPTRLAVGTCGGGGAPAGGALCLSLLADAGEPLVATSPALGRLRVRYERHVLRKDAPESEVTAPGVACPRVVAKGLRRGLVAVHGMRDFLGAPAALALVAERQPHAQLARVAQWAPAELANDWSRLIADHACLEAAGDLKGARLLCRFLKK